MGHLLMTIPAAIAVFAVTNIDDLVVLTVLFVVSRTQLRPHPWRVVAGQAAGIAVLVGSALVAAVGLYMVPARWVGLLGVFPLAIGIWKLAQASPDATETPTATSAGAGLTGVAGITVVNGADNIAIYTPFFRALEAGEVLVTIAVFVLMIGVWCALAAWLATHLSTLATIKRYSHHLVPVVLIVFGAIIITRSVLA
jgi:cadmium resistance protein CadD (predicted permease)